MEDIEMGNLLSDDQTEEESNDVEEHEEEQEEEQQHEEEEEEEQQEAEEKVEDPPLVAQHQSHHQPHLHLDAFVIENFWTSLCNAEQAGNNRATRSVNIATAGQFSDSVYERQTAQATDEAHTLAAFAREEKKYLKRVEDGSFICQAEHMLCRGPSGITHEGCMHPWNRKKGHYKTHAPNTGHFTGENVCTACYYRLYIDSDLVHLVDLDSAHRGAPAIAKLLENYGFNRYATVHSTEGQEMTRCLWDQHEKERSPSPELPEGHFAEGHHVAERMKFMQVDSQVVEGCAHQSD
jgi:hypothetical protein